MTILNKLLGQQTKQPKSKVEKIKEAALSYVGLAKPDTINPMFYVGKAVKLTDNLVEAGKEAYKAGRK